MSKCPYCGSKYVKELAYVRTYRNILKYLECLSCRKKFNFEGDRGRSNDKWLMRIVCDSGYVDLYKSNHGEFTFFYYNGDYTEGFVTEIDFWRHESNIRFSIGAVTGGGGVVARELYINKELNEIALQNDAMKLIYKGEDTSLADCQVINWRLSEEGVFAYRFDKLRDSEELADDVRRWLSNAVSEFINCQKPQKCRSSKKARGCYVATAVYGSYDCPEVWTLRRFRDYTLDRTWYGKLFIKLYYVVSPTLVKWFGKTKWFKNMWKPTLDKMVKKLNLNGVENTPYEDKKY